MNYVMKTPPTDADCQQLTAAASQVDPEWVTVILLGYRVGITPGTARHLEWPSVSGGCISFTHRLRVWPVKREMPPDMVAHLESLKRASSHICPRLHELTSPELCLEWTRVCRLAKVKISLIALTWPYADAHRESIASEHSRGYLEKLANKWLEPAEVEKLRVQAIQWAGMPAKTGNGSRRRTRAELLGNRAVSASLTNCASALPTPTLASGIFTNGGRRKINPM